MTTRDYVFRTLALAVVWAGITIPAVTSELLLVLDLFDLVIAITVLATACLLTFLIWCGPELVHCLIPAAAPHAGARKRDAYPGATSDAHLPDSVATASPVESRSTAMPSSSPSPPDIPVAPPLRYARIYTDANGDSHLTDDELSFELADYAPPAAPISVTEMLGAQAVTFISSPPGWFGDWHPAPRRQFIFVLTGVLEVEVTGGVKRAFGPGSVLLVEDTSGKGHISRVTSEERALAVAVPLA